MTVLLQILQVFIALSLLIAIHEAGHFIFARLSGTRVDKFFLFFDAGGIKLFSTKTTGWFTRLFPKMKEAETEYGIGWLPIGGYCKINGMIDESFDIESMRQEPKPWEFRSKPAWQRLLIMLGGVLFNFIFAIMVYIFIMDKWGQSYIPNSESRIYASARAEDLGFRTGDRILDFDGYIPEDFLNLQSDLARRNVNVTTVLRDNDTVRIYMDRSRIGDIVNTPMMFDLAFPFIINDIVPESANSGSGLMPGDRIIAIDSCRTDYFQDAAEILSNCSGETVPVSVLRGSDTLSFNLIISEEGKIGVSLESPYRKKEYNFFQAIPAGMKYSFDTLKGYIQDLKLVFTPKTGAYKSVGSVITIVQVFPEKWNWFRFCHLIAIISIMLGVMNLLPIPGLDGGHAMLLCYEILTGNKPSDKFLIVAQAIGMVLLLALMILALGNDIGRLID